MSSCRCAYKSSTRVLTSIEIENFRCIEHAALEFHPRGTGIVGKNASGKTSLLEATFFLGHGRSFRTATRAKLVRRGSDHLRIIGRVQRGERSVVASAEHGDGATQMRLAGQGVAGVADIAAVLPLQVIDPGVHRLIDEGSMRRRRLLDWGVFHVKQDFLYAWRRYQRALSQRNAALRDDLEDRVVDAWDVELLESAERIDTARAEYMTCLGSHFAEMASSLMEESVDIEYRRGWPSGEALRISLEQARAKDRRLGTTTVGPHRADLNIRVDGVLARDRVSRGQQKVLAAALILAQVRATLSEDPHARTCLLLDDPAAELDVDKLGKLLKVIQQIPAQLIVTAVTEAGLRGIEIGRAFHVEQGCFTPML
jgi:DNA replication and repair protein RecF